MEIDPVAAGLGLIAGFIIGMAYFAGLWWTIRRLPDAERPTLLWGISALVRTAAATAVFYGLLAWGERISDDGGYNHLVPVIAGLLGFLGARLVASEVWGSMRVPKIDGSRGAEK